MFENLKRMDDHAHSEYSNERLIDSINRIPDMMIKAYELGYSGITLTDHETLSGHVEWLQTEAKLKESGKIPQDFKCALGNEIYLVDDRTNIDKYWHYILIAKNDMGHRALRELSSTAWYNGFNSRGMMRVPTEKRELEEIVRKYPNSLIATNACIGGELGGLTLRLLKAEAEQNEDEIYLNKKKIADFINWNLVLFGNDFYLEIAAGTSLDQRKFNQRIKSIGRAFNLKMIIGSDAHYLTANERPIHKAYLLSKEGEREVDEFYTDSHFMTAEEAYNNIKAYYSKEEFEQMCHNSMEIYEKVGAYHLAHKPIIPEVEVSEYPKQVLNLGYETLDYLLSSNEVQERYWVNQCLAALEEKQLKNEQYLSRLETEADIIKTIGEKLDNCLFKYFNTFQHYIDLFWACGSIVGPGRGSAVCFLSNYLLGITQLDPLQWALPEWRFLNKERVELPKLEYWAA